MASHGRVLFTIALFAGAASAQNTPFTISNLTLSGAISSAGQISGTGTATVSGLANGSVAVTLGGAAPPTGSAQFTETFMFDSSDSLTLSVGIPQAMGRPDPFTVTVSFNVTSGTGIYGGRGGSGTLTLTIQSVDQSPHVGPLTITGSGSGTLAAQMPTTPFTVSNLTSSWTVNSAGQISGTGTATVTGFASGAVAFTETGMAEVPCGGAVALSQTFTFNSNDSLTLSEAFPASCTSSNFTITTGFNTSGTGAYSGRSGSGTLTLTIQSNQNNGAGPFTGTGSGSGTLLAQVPTVTPGGIVPVYSTVPTVQPGEWVSIYGTGLASSAVTWNGNFPTSLGGTTVTVDGKPAYLWFVSPTQINLQTPDDTSTLPATVPVVVTTATGIFSSTVTLAQYGPSFNLLDSTHVAGIILRSDGSGAYGGGSYDILGPTGNSLGYATVAAKAGDVVELFGVGFGPTTPPVPAGQAFSGSAPTTNSVNLLINNQNVTPGFAGLSDSGLYQINLTVPAGLGTGDVPLVATVGGVQTPSTVVISLR